MLKSRVGGEVEGPTPPGQGCKTFLRSSSRLPVFKAVVACEPTKKLAVENDRAQVNCAQQGEGDLCDIPLSADGKKHGIVLAFVSGRCSA